MAKSECMCKHYSCESLLKQTGDEYSVNTEMRFRFEKNNDGCIINGGMVEGSILNCPIIEGRTMSKKMQEEHNKLVQSVKTL